MGKLYSIGKGTMWVVGSLMTHMLHGAGMFTNICPNNHPHVGKYTIYIYIHIIYIYTYIYYLYIYIHMEHMGMCNTDFSIFSKVFPVPDLWGNFQRSHIDLTVQFILNYYPTLWFMCFFHI